MDEKGRRAVHDLRNLLGLVALEVDAAKTALRDSQATRRSLDEIASLVERCTEALVSLEQEKTSR